MTAALDNGLLTGTFNAKILSYIKRISVLEIKHDF